MGAAQKAQAVIAQKMAPRKPEDQVAYSHFLDRTFEVVKRQDAILKELLAEYESLIAEADKILESA
jgi:hypothetical protein